MQRNKVMAYTEKQWKEMTELTTQCMKKQEKKRAIACDSLL